MISLREKVFETNSSSTHSLTLCTKKEYDAWKAGETVFSKGNESLIPVKDLFDLCIKSVKREIDHYEMDTEGTSDWRHKCLVIDKYVLEHANKEVFDKFVKEQLRRCGKVGCNDEYVDEDGEVGEYVSLYDVWDKNFEGATDVGVILALLGNYDDSGFCTEEEYYHDDWFETFCTEKELDGVAVVAFGLYGHD